jgi:hypothetical protein
MQMEQVTDIAPEVFGSLTGEKLLAPRVPHCEERRARPILPPEYDIRLKLHEVEPARIARH